MAELGQELILESKAGNVIRVRALLERGAPVDSEDKNKQTPLMCSSLNGYLVVVKLLTAWGANVNHQSAPCGSTSLHAAALRDHLPVCLFLISLGADPMAENINQNNALSLYGEGMTTMLTPNIIESRRDALKQARNAYPLILPTHLNRFGQMNASLLFSATFSDLVFVCPGGKRIHAHRNIVAACSPHMNALLQGPWAENAGRGQVSEVKMPQSAASVRALLRFMYTGEVDAAACVSHTMDVLDLASQHEQPELKKRCAAHAAVAISQLNVYLFIDYATMHDIPNLVSACVSFVERHLSSLNLIRLIESANFWEIPKLKSASERGLMAALSTANVLSSLEAALDLDLPLLKAACITFVEMRITQLSLFEVVKFANKHSLPELKAGCERGCIAVLTASHALSSLETAMRLGLQTLKSGCIAYIRRDPKLILSDSLDRLVKVYPWLRRDLQAAAGVSEEPEALGLKLLCEATAGNREQVAALLEQGAPVDYWDPNGDHLTALMRSSWKGHLDVVVLLIHKGANMNFRGETGDTALLCAAFHDRLPVCLFLISQGADPMAKDCSDRTALTCYGQGRRPKLRTEVIASSRAALITARKTYFTDQITLLERPDEGVSALGLRVAGAAEGNEEARGQREAASTLLDPDAASKGVDVKKGVEGQASKRARLA